MKSTKTLVSFVALFAVLLATVSMVSAQVTFTDVEVNGVTMTEGAPVAAFAGQSLPVRIIFHTDVDAEDARVKVWISGDRDYSVSTERFDLIAGNTYSRLVSVDAPFDIDPSEDLKLEIVVESKSDGQLAYVEYDLTGQRDSYVVEVLDVSMDPRVAAGDNLALDIVLKNRGRHFSEDTFVRVTVPALGIERKAYFGDLSPVDQPLRDGSDDRLDNEDAAERRILLSIPASAPAGIYTVEIEAVSADSSTVTTRKIAVVGAGSESMVVPSTDSKTFSPGEDATYSVTLVNSGSTVRVYNVVFEASSGLTVTSDDSVVVVPAGSSKTVKAIANAEKAGKYTFNANVYSNGELVKRQTFVANVEGSKGVGSANATVVLTVVLAIIFVVLLVVLIVLLTRKPQKTEEFGESYY